MIGARVIGPGLQFVSGRLVLAGRDLDDGQHDAMAWIPPDPFAHPDVSSDPSNEPLSPGLDELADPEPNVQYTYTDDTENPPAGVNRHATDPDNPSPGTGAVSAPGTRLSTPSCVDACAANPAASTARRRTV